MLAARSPIARRPSPPSSAHRRAAGTGSCPAAHHADGRSGNRRSRRFRGGRLLLGERCAGDRSGRSSPGSRPAVCFAVLHRSVGRLARRTGSRPPSHADTRRRADRGRLPRRQDRCPDSLPASAHGRTQGRDAGPTRSPSPACMSRCVGAPPTEGVMPRRGPRRPVGARTRAALVRATHRPEAGRASWSRPMRGGSSASLRPAHPWRPPTALIRRWATCTRSTSIRTTGVGASELLCTPLLSTVPSPTASPTPVSGPSTATCVALRFYDRHELDRYRPHDRSTAVRKIVELHERRLHPQSHQLTFLTRRRRARARRSTREARPPDPLTRSSAGLRHATAVVTLGERRRHRARTVPGRWPPRGLFAVRPKVPRRISRQAAQ